MIKLNLFALTDELTTPIYRRRSKEVSFEFPAPEAKTVTLTGDFVSWDPKGIPMKKDKSGLWRTKVRLCSGRYEYKFIVDDTWQIDPLNPKTATNSCGSLNSVKEIAV